MFTPLQIQKPENITFSGKKSGQKRLKKGRRRSKSSWYCRRTQKLFDNHKNIYYIYKNTQLEADFKVGLEKNNLSIYSLAPKEEYLSWQ